MLGVWKIPSRVWRQDDVRVFRQACRGEQTSERHSAVGLLPLHWQWHSHRARKSASDSLNDSSLVSQAGYYSQGQARGWIRIFLCIQYFHVTARYWRRLCCTVKTYWQVFRKGKREMTWHGWCDTIYVVSACNAWRRSAPIVSVSSPSLSVCLSPPLSVCLSVYLSVSLSICLSVSVCLSRCEHAPFCVKILMYQI